MSEVSLLVLWLVPSSSENFSIFGWNSPCILWCICKGQGHYVCFNVWQYDRVPWNIIKRLKLMKTAIIYPMHQFAPWYNSWNFPTPLEITQKGHQDHSNIAQMNANDLIYQYSSDMKKQHLYVPTVISQMPQPPRSRPKSSIELGSNCTRMPSRVKGGVLRPEPSSASKWESVFGEVLKGLWNRGSSWYFMVLFHGISWYFMVYDIVMIYFFVWLWRSKDFVLCEYM